MKSKQQTKQRVPRLRADRRGTITVVDHDGFPMQTVTLDKAQEMKARGEIIAARRLGFARLADIPVTDATPEEIAAIKRRVELRRERDKAERRGRRVQR